MKYTSATAGRGKRGPSMTRYFQEERWKTNKARNIARAERLKIKAAAKKARRTA